MGKGNFKVRVIKHLDSFSETCFRTLGSVFEVRDGTLFDTNGNGWNNKGNGFKTIHEVNEYFSIGLYVLAKFELVEDEMIKCPACNRSTADLDRIEPHLHKYHCTCDNCGNVWNIELTKEMFIEEQK